MPGTSNTLLFTSYLNDFERKSLKAFCTSAAFTFFFFVFCFNELHWNKPRQLVWAGDSELWLLPLCSQTPSFMNSKKRNYRRNKLLNPVGRALCSKGEKKKTDFFRINIYSLFEENPQNQAGYCGMPLSNSCLSNYLLHVHSTLLFLSPFFRDWRGLFLSDCEDKLGSTCSAVLGGVANLRADETRGGGGPSCLHANIQPSSVWNTGE